MKFNKRSDGSPTVKQTHTVLFHLRHNRRLIVVAIALSLAYFTFGYDGSVFGGVIAMPAFIRQFGQTQADGTSLFTSTQTSVITAVPVVGAVISLPLTAWSADRFGRIKTIMVAAVAGVVGAAMEVVASELGLMTAGRTVATGAVYCFLVMASTLISELAPSELRGTLGSLSIVLINTASVVTSGTNWATSTKDTSEAYRLPLGLQIAWAIVVFLAILLVKDSPTFFLMKSQDEKAEQSLRHVRQGYSDDEMYAELALLRAQASLVQEEKSIPWTALFKGPDLRRTLLALSVGNFQQMSGIAFATNYATIFLKQVSPSTDPFLLVLALNILSLGGSVVGLLSVDIVGRRTLALSTFVVIFFIDLSIGIMGFFNGPDNESVAKGIAACSLMFGFFFAAGFGPLTYIISAEMPTARLRNKTSAFTFLTIAIFNLIIAYVLPYISQEDAGNLGAKTYLIFAGWMGVGTIGMYFCLPETKGRAAAELDEMFEAKVSARKFKAYVSLATNQDLELERSLSSAKNISVLRKETA